MATAKPGSPQLAAWRSFLEAHHRLTRILDAELVEAHDLSLEWYDVLVQLDEGGGDRTMSDLANSLLISPSNCTRLVARMVQAGLVERHHDETDRRVVHATLTRTGRAKLRRASPTHLRGIGHHFGRFLSDHDADLVAGRLRAVVDEIDGAADRS